MRHRYAQPQLIVENTLPQRNPPHHQIPTYFCSPTMPHFIKTILSFIAKCFTQVGNLLRKVPVLGPACICVVQTVGSVPFLLWCTLIERRDARSKRKEKLRLESYRFPPPVSKRGRALSVEVRKNERKFGVGTVVRKKMQHQTGSDLFRLPFELREQIYRNCFHDGEEIAVLCRRAGLRSYVVWRESRRGVVASDKWGMKGKPEVIGLLLTCRRVYNEAVLYMYSCPTFIFIDALSFIAFSHSILPSRFNSIQSIRLNYVELEPRLPREIDLDREQGLEDLSWYRPDSVMTYSNLYVQRNYGNPTYAQLRFNDTFWAATCRALARMESLSSLDILIKKRCFNTDEELTKPLEEPQIVQLQDFVLRLATWDSGLHVERQGGWRVVEEWQRIVENGRLCGWDRISYT
ncbi:hypothetical protein BDV96DRAFT_563199 [Lophiotrema nucula]|uniref:DUF7730 domain-containing protein n=1 Tax=Lophiotrema nucula TaxID=690887 RepID=A0A6A5ZT75_9PLEO|nr:hypothetical protein BDV96DRAFT_563199 [Lophiotrema nucula]